MADAPPSASGRPPASGTVLAVGAVLAAALIARAAWPAAPLGIWPLALGACAAAAFLRPQPPLTLCLLPWPGAAVVWVADTARGIPTAWPDLAGLALGGLLALALHRSGLAASRSRQEAEARDRELREALEVQTATSEVLKSIGGTSFDLRAVLQSLLATAARLCGGELAGYFHFEGGTFTYMANWGVSEAYREVESQTRIELNRGTLVGRAGVERRTVHVDDAMTDPEYAVKDEAAVGGVRTMLGVPLLRDGELLGVFALARSRVSPFSDHEIRLVTLFAEQAAVAVENARLFREIQDKGRQLEAANQHKSEFLANMSHELRTPLNAIIGFSEVMMEGMFGDLNEKQLEYTRDIHASGRHLLSLINDILDLSKIEAGRTDLEISRFDLPAAIGNAVTLVRERALRHGIHLGVSIDPALGPCEGDERKFKQIMLNLLSNAVKFTGDGGQVKLVAEHHDGWVRVAVSDTGIGIAPEDQPKVFEAFVQVGSHYETKREGTGLGLPLARRFVELHGGTMGLESTPGQGSTFHFTLPLNRTETRP